MSNQGPSTTNNTPKEPNSTPAAAASIGTANVAPAQGAPKLVQRVFRKPNGQLHVVTEVQGGNGATTTAGAVNAAGMPTNYKGPRVPGSTAGWTTINPPPKAQQQPQYAGGIFSSTRVVKFLYALRNVALFVVSIAILNLILNYFGALPTVVIAFALYKAGMFVMIESIFSNLHGVLSGDEAAYELALRRADSMRAPVTKKEGSISQSSATISYGFSCMQGWRRSMEDAHTMILDGVKAPPHGPVNLNRIPTAPSLGTINTQGIVNGKGGFFAVFDGHCGQRVANYCSEHLYHFVTKSPAWTKKDYKQALIDGFVALDQHLYQHNMEERSGCTAVAVLISEDGTKLYCANAGDSRAILGRDPAAPLANTNSGTITAADGTTYTCSNGVGFDALSDDHKPYNRSEQLRIQKAGGVVFNKRVNGILALSRAIGDFSFKKNKSVPWVDQAVTCMPDVREVPIDLDRDQFIVLACDGIWDVRTNEDVALFVRQRLQKRVALHTICEQLVHACLSNRPFGNGCDNMSAIVVTLDQSKFMKSVGGAAVGGMSSPLVRAPASPVSSPAKTFAAATTAATSSSTTGEAFKIPASAATNRKLDTSDSLNSSTSAASPQPTPKRAAPPSLLSPTSASAAAVASAVPTPAAVSDPTSSPVVSVASPSVRASGGGFPPKQAAVEVTNPTKLADDVDTDGVVSPTSVLAAVVSGDADEGDNAISGAASATTNTSADADETSSREEIAAALEDAELFSPKTPCELRDGAKMWEEAEGAAEADVGDEDGEGEEEGENDDDSDAANPKVDGDDEDGEKEDSEAASV